MYKLYVYYENTLEQLKSVGPKPTPGFEKKFSVIEAYVPKEKYKEIAASSLTKLEVIESNNQYLIQKKVEKELEIQPICNFAKKHTHSIIHNTKTQMIYTTDSAEYKVTVTKKSDPTEVYDFITITDKPQKFIFDEYSLYGQDHYCEYIIERTQ